MATPSTFIVSIITLLLALGYGWCLKLVFMCFEIDKVLLCVNSSWVLYENGAGIS